MGAIAITVGVYKTLKYFEYRKILKRKQIYGSNVEPKQDNSEQSPST